MDSPRRRGRPKKENAEAKLEQGAAIGVLATALGAVFIIPSVALGPHWILNDDEAMAGAESLQKALSTLPGSTYADVKKYLDKFVPWVALAIVMGQIVAPRIEETQRRRTERGGEEFPDSVEIPTSGYTDPTMRQRSDASGNGQAPSSPDPFRTYPGAD